MEMDTFLAIVGAMTMTRAFVIVLDKLEGRG